MFRDFLHYYTLLVTHTHYFYSHYVHALPGTHSHTLYTTFTLTTLTCTHFCLVTHLLFYWLFPHLLRATHVRDTFTYTAYYFDDTSGLRHHSLYATSTSTCYTSHALVLSTTHTVLTHTFTWTTHFRLHTHTLYTHYTYRGLLALDTFFFLGPFGFLHTTHTFFWHTFTYPLHTQPQPFS